MSQIRVEDICAGALDSTGASIVTVYTKIDQRYAVYGTADQVKIQFADNDGEGVNQRAALTPLGSMRGQVNAMIGALRESGTAYQLRKAREYEGRMASALAVALQGDVTQGLVDLTAIRDDMAEDRASDIRTRHILYAAGATMVMILIARLLASDWFNGAFGPFDPTISPLYWNAAAIGALGALFSIALQIRSREVPIDLQPWDNASDAVLRVFVGATSGLLLIALLKANIINLGIADQNLNTMSHGLIIAAFAGGFTERLASDFLSGLTITTRSRAAADATVTSQGGVGTTERTITGEASAGRPTVPPREGPVAAPSVGIPRTDAEKEDAVEPDEEEEEAQVEAESPSDGSRLGALQPMG